MSRQPRTALGPVIRDLRQEADYCAEYLAWRVGISKQHLWNIESGHKRASGEVIHRLARVFDVHVNVISVVNKTAKRA